MRFLRALGVLCICACSRVSAETFLVLPFFNTSNDTSIEWIGEALSETVREALGREGAIALDPDARQEAYRRLSIRPHIRLTKATILKLGEVIDADRVVHGRFEFAPPSAGLPRTKGSLRIVAQVFNIRKSSQTPEYSEQGALEDLARLQTHLAWQTIRSIDSRNGLSEEEFLKRNPIVRVEAIELRIRALLTPNPDQKLKLLTQAVRLDPNYSQANFALGQINFQRSNWKQAADWLTKVSPEDVHYREARFFLGLCQYKSGEFAAAEEAFQTVVAAVPLNEVWNNLGASQVRQAKAEALENFQKALEGDPADIDYQFNVALGLFLAGELDQAAQKFRAVLDRDPDDAEAIIMLGRSLKRLPQRSSAQAPLARIKETFEESAWLQLKAVLESKR